MKVLVIEDEFDIRANIETLLLEEGYKVETASNGTIGVEKAKAFSPDIIICDILMNGMNGYEVLNQLLKDKKTCSIPFIFLTAKAEKEEIRLGMELGADDYITKPFKNSELLKAIETRIRKKMIFKQVKDNPKTDEKEELWGLDKNIFVKSKNGIDKFKVSEINYILAANQYSEVHLINKNYYVFHKSLKKWETLLPKDNFLRIHKSTIINIGNVLKFEKFFSNSYRIYLKGVDTPFEISKRKLAVLDIQN